ncbi:MAG: N-acetylneuraminate synthase family protein [Opitutae bacterium]|nr:N-acetylneuraminate synthase family protein [Opitutae bacterium]
MNPSASPLFIFEMANNHQGDIAHGRRIIDEMAKIARRFGIRAGVKLQYRNLDTFIHPDFRASEHKHIKRFLSTELKKDDYATLVEAIRDAGLLTICTPFDEESVDDIVNHGIEIVKVASCSANDWPLLERIVQTRKPVICSSGGLRLDEIDQVVNFFMHRHVKDFSLLHCVGIYPTQNKGVHLNFMDTLARRFHWLPVGYSGHEAPDNYDVVKAAVAKGARILERHVGVPTEKIPLNAYSMNPEQTAKWVESALLVQEICGAADGSKKIAQEEIDSLLSLRRGTFARDAVAQGETLSREKVFFAMPCAEGQTSSSEFQESMTASAAIAKNGRVTERRQRTLANQLRSLIHQAKGMLHEAHIAIGDKFTIEMSHHYGPEQFRSNGALIVNLVNREYCKKLIIMLPGQRHPNHRHMKKEETFQLLRGDIEVNLNGVLHNLKAGDILLVERGTWHSFSTQQGCIFEEVSTTHIIGDSYYEDPKIAALDPMQRKTVLTMW